MCFYKRLFPTNRKLLIAIYKGMKIMTVEMDLLRAEVTETSAAVDVAVAKIAELAAFIRDNVNDPAALLAMAAELDADQAKVAAAVTPAT